MEGLLTRNQSRQVAEFVVPFEVVVPLLEAFVPHLEVVEVPLEVVVSSLEAFVPHLEVVASSLEIVVPHLKVVEVALEVVVFFPGLHNAAWLFLLTPGPNPRIQTVLLVRPV